MTDLMLSMCSGACFNPQVKEGGFGQVLQEVFAGIKDAFEGDLGPTPLHLLMGLLGLRGLCPQLPTSTSFSMGFSGLPSGTSPSFPAWTCLAKTSDCYPTQPSWLASCLSAPLWRQGCPALLHAAAVCTPNIPIGTRAIAGA